MDESKPVMVLVTATMVYPDGSHVEGAQVAVAPDSFELVIGGSTPDSFMDPSVTHDAAFNDMLDSATELTVKGRVIAWDNKSLRR